MAEKGDSVTAAQHACTHSPRSHMDQAPLEWTCKASKAGPRRSLQGNVSCTGEQLGKRQGARWAAGQEQALVKNDERQVGRAHWGRLGRQLTGEEDSSKKRPGLSRLPFCLQGLLLRQNQGSENTCLSSLKPLPLLSARQNFVLRLPESVLVFSTNSTHSGEAVNALNVILKTITLISPPTCK